MACHQGSAGIDEDNVRIKEDMWFLAQGPESVDLEGMGLDDDVIIFFSFHQGSAFLCGLTHC